jgi:lactate dehydrogenase-like 2-hydroxyacid dehydrogenase
VWTLPLKPNAKPLTSASKNLLQQADHVVLVVPYSKASHHTIGAAELALMKPTATITNIARGGIIDDAALGQGLAARANCRRWFGCVRERASS